MVEPHHDPDLCKRLAEKVMGWTLRPNPVYLPPKPTQEQIQEAENHGSFVDSNGGHILWRDKWNPCCNPAHSWMLEQKMGELGFDYNGGSKVCRFWKNGRPTSRTGSNRLHATALAANEVSK